jgi:hypothetical protein
MMRYILFALLISLLSACASIPVAQPANKIAKNFLVPDRAKRIVILPTKVDTEEYVPGGPAVKRQLYAQLQHAGYQVVALDEKNYAEVWGQEVTAVGGLFDPQSGRFRPDAYALALSHLVTRISGEIDCSMVLAPRLLSHSAKLTRDTASWDGVVRMVHEKDQVLMTDPTYEYSGTVIGLSAELMAFNSRGEWQFTTYGGILLPHESDTKKKKIVVRQDLFSNPREIYEASNLVLRPLLPTAP